MVLRHTAVSNTPDEHGTKLSGTSISSWLWLNNSGITLSECENSSPGVAFIGLASAADGFGQSDRHNEKSTKSLLLQAFTRIPSNFCIGVQSNLSLRDNPVEYRKYRSQALLTPKEGWTNTGEHNHLIQGWEQQSYDNGWILLWNGKDPRPELNLERHLDHQAKADDLDICFWLFEKSSSAQKIQSPLAKVWLETLKHPVIPYNLDERQKILKEAIMDLQNEIKQWIGIKKRKEEIMAEWQKFLKTTKDAQ